MKVLVIGSGAREHALAWAIRRSPSVSAVFVAPGNAGTALVARNVAIKADDVAALIEFARREEIDLTVVGPEGPLMLGVVDRFRDAGLAIYGPTAAAARLEGSKAFSKHFMQRHAIPTARFDVFEEPGPAKEFARALGAPVVVKADGLAAGKGVVVASTLKEAEDAIDDMLLAKKFGAAGSRVVIEEFLQGEEVSVHAMCAGTSAVLFPSSQDHKRAYDGDCGPNTGGMGAIAPVPRVSDADLEHVRKTVIVPVLEGMQKEGAPFAGTLYAGLMWTPNGPRVLEFNVRFGDPETEALMPLLAGDVASLLLGAAQGNLPAHIETRGGSAAAVVIAAKGYPGEPETGSPVEGLNDIPQGNVAVFHGGTRTEDNKMLSTAGRILTVSGWGDDLQSALDAAYDAVRRIKITGSFFRGDIGRRHIGADRERTKR
ncbi:MAG TPA: phosphoribosylamine--glycine ligase [Candidatus Krumholzibacteria bacterium]|nr:phosphoribosylamine--glycine ligase [Candidatus Krumholzibacteria bacterium]